MHKRPGSHEEHVLRHAQGIFVDACDYDRQQFMAPPSLVMMNARMEDIVCKSLVVGPNYMQHGDIESHSFVKAVIYTSHGKLVSSPPVKVTPGTRYKITVVGGGEAGTVIDIAVSKGPSLRCSIVLSRDLVGNVLVGEEPCSNTEDITEDLAISVRFPVSVDAVSMLVQHPEILLAACTGRLSESPMAFPPTATPQQPFPIGHHKPPQQQQNAHAPHNPAAPFSNTTPPFQYSNTALAPPPPPPPPHPPYGDTIQNPSQRPQPQPLISQYPPITTVPQPQAHTATLPPDSTPSATAAWIAQQLATTSGQHVFAPIILDSGGSGGGGAGSKKDRSASSKKKKTHYSAYKNHDTINAINTTAPFGAPKIVPLMSSTAPRSGSIPPTLGLATNNASTLTPQEASLLSGALQYPQQQAPYPYISVPVTVTPPQYQQPLQYPSQYPPLLQYQ